MVARCNDTAALIWWLNALVQRLWYGGLAQCEIGLDVVAQRIEEGAMIWCLSALIHRPSYGRSVH